MRPNLHQSVRIVPPADQVDQGAFDPALVGLVGTVDAIEGDEALVLVSGVRDGESLQASTWFPLAWLEIVG